MDNSHILKQTHIGDVMVSTISLIALDLQFEELSKTLGGNDESLPRFSDYWRRGKFETMVFGMGDYQQYRYGTVEEALAHHDELVAQLELLKGGDA